MLICPNCGKALNPDGNTYRCAAGHSFDVASSGYCNLLCGTKPGEFTGDSREMVAARRQFLDTGAYEKLRDAVCERVRQLKPLTAVDAGCGEGYYTREISKCVSGEVIGIDIAKSATQYAAKRDKKTVYVTASAYRMPIADKSADLVLSLFAPTPAEEFARILKDDGCVLTVVPGTEHLWELKQAIYDEPYLNREDKHSLEGFALVHKQKLTYETDIVGNDNIRALFSMTPYIHRTSKEGMDRLGKLDEIKLTLSFVLLTYKRENIEHLEE